MEVERAVEVSELVRRQIKRVAGGAAVEQAERRRVREVLDVGFLGFLGGVLGRECCVCVF